MSIFVFASSGWQLPATQNVLKNRDSLPMGVYMATSVVFSQCSSAVYAQEKYEGKTNVEKVIATGSTGCERTTSATGVKGKKEEFRPADCSMVHNDETNPLFGGVCVADQKSDLCDPCFNPSPRRFFYPQKYPTWT
eukprot:5207822-Amphidinium_carterae.1